MRRLLLLTTVLLALCGWVVAQQEPSSQNPPSASQGGAQPSAGQNSVQGCLGGSGNNFTVTDNSGTSYQLQLPQGADPSSLKPHVGEEVRVEGTMGGNSGSNPSAGSSSTGQHTIAVNNIYRISKTCSTNNSGGAPKGH